MRVLWLLRARRELRAQRQYIAQDRPAAAAGIIHRIWSAVERLAIYPCYGRTALWDATGRFRELPVARTSFVVVYEVNETLDAVIILGSCTVVSGVAPSE